MGPHIDSLIVALEHRPQQPGPSVIVNAVAALQVWIKLLMLRRLINRTYEWRVCFRCQKERRRLLS